MTRPNTIRAYVVPADEAFPARLIRIEANLEGIREAIGGGYLEGFSGHDFWGYCDEEGKLNDLPYNRRGTRIARLLGWRNDDSLNGDVVFLGRPDSEGYDTDVSNYVLSIAKRVADPGLLR